VVTSAVYRHFKSKDEVLDAVLDHAAQSLQNNVDIARSAALEPLARLRAMLLGHVELVAGGIPIPRIILSEAVFTGKTRHRRRVLAIYRAYLGEVAEVIRDGQKQGSFSNKTKPETLSLMWLGLIQPPAILWLLNRGSFDLREHCQRAWQVFADTILNSGVGTSKSA
jgi:AcrR family transcriptional regulator